MEKKSLVDNGRLEPLNWNKLEDVHSAEEEEQQEGDHYRHYNYNNNDSDSDNDNDNYNNEILKEKIETKTEGNVKKSDKINQSNEKEEQEVQTEDLLGLFTMMEDGKQTPSNGSSPENKKNGPDLLDNEDNAFESFDEAFTRRNPEHSDKEDSLSDHDDHEHNSQEEIEMNNEEYYYMQKQFHTGDEEDGNVEKENNNNNRQYVRNASKAKARNSEPNTIRTSGGDQTSPVILERKIGVDLHKKGADMRVRSDIHEDGSNKFLKVDEKESTVQKSSEQKKNFLLLCKHPNLQLMKCTIVCQN